MGDTRDTQMHCKGLYGNGNTRERGNGDDDCKLGIAIRNFLSSSCKIQDPPHGEIRYFFALGFYFAYLISYGVKV